MSQPSASSEASPAGAAGSTGSQSDGGKASIGDLLGEVTRDLSTLMRQEVDLAKAEIKSEVAKAGKGAGMLGGAGFAGYMVVLFLSLAAWWGLAAIMNTGLAAVIVALIWVVIGAVLATVGRSTLRRVNPKPERTIDTAKKIPDAVKGN